MKAVPAVSAVWLSIAGLAASAADHAGCGGMGWVGYRGPNGTGVFADSRPPSTCSCLRAALRRRREAGRFYGLDGSERTCDGNFSTYATLTCQDTDGKLLGQSRLTAVPVEGEKLEQVRSQVGWDRWPFVYGFPFTIAGNRIYVRGFDELICIGER